MKSFVSIIWLLYLVTIYFLSSIAPSIALKCYDCISHFEPKCSGSVYRDSAHLKECLPTDFVCVKIINGDKSLSRYCGGKYELTNCMALPGKCSFCTENACNFY